jgi:hypothetical protein
MSVATQRALLATTLLWSSVLGACGGGGDETPCTLSAAFVTSSLLAAGSEDTCVAYSRANDKKYCEGCGPAVDGPAAQ